MKKVAIFDIDGTIFRSSLLVELVNGLIAEGIFPKRAAGIYAKPHREWLDRKGSYRDYINAVVKAFDRHIRGVRYADFERVAKRVVASYRDRVYRYTRNLARDLKRRGYYLLAISHSPKLAVDVFARRLGFNKVYGLMYAVDKRGRFTGRMLHEEEIFDKAKILRRAAEKERLTMQGSIGVGDTDADITFLTFVSHPICFNPNQKLFRHARRCGWKVVVERKDVIYTLE